MNGPIRGIKKAAEERGGDKKGIRSFVMGGWG